MNRMRTHVAVVVSAAVAAGLWIYLHRRHVDGEPNDQLAPPRQLRLALFTLEYRFQTFSGNGIYSIAQANSLAAIGHKVLVVCAAPGSSSSSSSGGSNGNPTEILLPVPDDSWGSLAKDGGWVHYVKAASSAATVAAVRAWKPDAILPVDWHGFAAASPIIDSYTPGVKQPPVVWLNYRVFSRSATAASSSDAAGETASAAASDSAAFYRQMEGAAAKQASRTVALARADEAMLKDLGGTSATTVLLPALRDDIKQLADKLLAGAPTPRSEVGSSPPTNARILLVCCVRLSPEKGGLLFAEVVHHLAHFLTAAGITPVLCAAPAPKTASYRAHVVDAFMAANVPGSRVIPDFIGAEELAALQSAALLNFHPPTYDAYGMTVVEAAAFGSPSVLHAPAEHAVSAHGGTSESTDGVGAAELLRPSRGESFHVDLSAEASVVAAAVQTLLSDRPRLQQVGEAAQARALSWTVNDNALNLAEIVHGELRKMRH